MNITHHIDQLQILGHISKLAKIQKAVQAAGLSAAVPQTVQTTHYGPQGTDVASISNSSFSKVKTASDGSIVGGTLSHSATDEKGNPMNSSEVNFTGEGKPSVINTTINNRFEEGVFKKISTDMSAVNWQDASTISSGNVKITTTHNNNVRSTGQITYANELVSKGSFAHYSTQGEGTLTGHTDIDYTQAKFVGNTLVGGYIGIASKTANQVVKSNSNMFMDALGRVNQIHTNNLDSTGKTKTSVIADFKGMNFTPRSEFSAGLAVYNVTNQAGQLQSETHVQFDQQIPVASHTQAYDEQQKPGNKIVIDYSNAKFNNDLKVVNSTIKSDVYNADEKLISSTETQYDANGSPVHKQIAQFDHQTGEPLKSISKDLSNVTFDHANQPLGGEVNVTTNDLVQQHSIETVKPIVPESDPAVSSSETSTITNDSSTTQATHCFLSKISNAAGEVTQIKESCTRANGSLYKVSVTNMSNNKPVSSTVSVYGTDGKTLNKMYKLNLSGVSGDSKNKVSGSIRMNAYFRGTTLLSESDLSY